MPTFVFNPGHITVPPWVADLDSFGRWVDSDEFPEQGRVSFFHGTVWMDSGMEQPFTHNLVKLWISIVLAQLARDRQLGRFYADRMRLRHDNADLSTEPDGMLVSYESTRTDRIRLVEGTATEYREFEGTPDMVLEVLSDSSEQKDRVDLRESYHLAGIDEYWLVDARCEPLEFDILRRASRGYISTRHQSDGWVRSRVFGRSFKLVRSMGPDEQPEFTLEHRD